MEIRKAKGREQRWMKKTYLDSFPKSERKPFGLMKLKVRQGVMEFLVILEKGRPVGLAITVLYRDLVLLDYFAIHRAYRGTALRFCGVVTFKGTISGKTADSGDRAAG